MKRILFTVLVAMMLVGCGRTVAEINFDTEIDAVKQHTLDFATGGSDIEEFRAVIEDFNDKLDKMGANKYAELQRQANDLRLEGFEQMDFDKINESTALQAEALEIYNEMKNAN